MKKQSSVIIGFLLVLIIVVFAVLNNRNVPVNFGIASFSAPLILVIIGSAIIGALIVFVTASSTLWQQKKQIKQLKQELSDYQENLDKKIAEAKEEQQRTFRNERAELEAAYQAELQATKKQLQQAQSSTSDTQKISAKQSYNYFD
ncbi:lipopolysaccharide assembly protein LapA domain-containing protein [Enterococcus hirae]|nr:lipopolysaccharide assembly protein LapA domain-containing protein [Enterococcus hirae]